VQRLEVAIAAALVACAGACTVASPTDEATSESAFSQADFAEGTVLPYDGGWLDPKLALGGLDQFDRLAVTVHDGDRCGAMVALAAAVIGGEAAFDALLSHVEARRALDPKDTKTLAAIRARFEARSLRTRELHLLADCMMRAYVPHSWNSGSADGEAASMIRASGWKSTRTSSSKPFDLVASLGPGEVVPLSLDVTLDGKGWHWILAWRDEGGALWLYNSDDVPGSHVHDGTSAAAGALLTNPTARFDLRETFHL
jgi:hypothetical protein